VGEMVELFAEVKDSGTPIDEKLVTFEIYGPSNPYENMYFVLGGCTNASGIASKSFRIGPMFREHWEEILLGTWRITVYVEINHEILTDNMTFECDWDLNVDLFTQKGGEGFNVGSYGFKAGEVMSLYMRVLNRTVPMPNIYVEFRADWSQNTTYYSALTNTSGIATLNIRFPWKVENRIDAFLYATMRFGDYAMYDSINIFCQVGERIYGDINYDSKVDMKDISASASSFGTHQGQSRWNPECDLNDDGNVNMKDIAKVARNFGKAL
jgi:hypothetical protein